MRKWLTLALAVLAANAQEPQKQKVPLSLAKAMEIALAPDGNTRARLAAELVKQAEARTNQAKGALLPNVDGSYTFRDFTNNLQSFGIQMPPGVPIPFQFPAMIGPLNVNDLRASAVLNVFDLAAIRRWQAAKTQTAAAREEESEAKNQVRGSVGKAYMNALRAEAALETAQANVALAERVVRLAKSQKESGTGTGIEITRSQVLLANEQQRQIAAAQERQTARLNLLRAMNMSLGTDFELTESIAYQPAEIPEAEKALAAAWELRPQLKAQTQREAGARLGYESAKYERVPSLRAFGDYGVIGKTGGSLLPTRTIGVSVTVPLWDGGRRDARREESASVYRQEQLRSRDAKQQVELEVRLALEALRSAENLVNVSVEARAQAERELEQAQRRVEAGVASGLEVTDAQTRVARAREAAVSAVFQQKAARIDLSVAVGNIEMTVR